MDSFRTVFKEKSVVNPGFLRQPSGGGVKLYLANHYLPQGKIIFSEAVVC